MLRKRIIFTLIYNDGYFAQSRNFRLQRVGDIRWLEKNYQFQKIAFSLDELIVLNASRGVKSMIDFAKIISALRKNVFIPIAAGGGIKTIEDAEILFSHGVDKIVINSALFNDPALISVLVKKYGSQSIIASIDYRKKNQQNIVFVNDGAVPITQTLCDYIEYIENLNVGEVYLNSIDKDGTGFGYDIDTINSINYHCQIPLIIAGGAGNEHHLQEGLQLNIVNAVATANLFNFVGDGLLNVRKKMIDEKMNVACWCE